MTSRTPLIAFIFARLNRKPRTPRDLSSNAWLLHQRRRIVGWARATGGEIVEKIVGTTTSTKPAFAKSSEFRRAIERAASIGANIVVADIQELLSRSDAEQILDCVNILDAAAVSVWDASRNIAWASQPSETRNAILLRAVSIRVSRSRPIKAGLRNRPKPPEPPTDKSKRLGALANQKRANVLASRLAALVNSEIEKLPPGAHLSPSRLASALNDAGIRPPRAAAWQHNSAKNLLRRLRVLGLIR